MQTVAPSTFRGCASANSRHNKISDLQRIKVWFGNCYIGQPRGREGIWGSAQRSRWKSWARRSGDHRDERQGEPALAFSILRLSRQARSLSGFEGGHTSIPNQMRAFADCTAPNKRSPVYCTFLSCARISSAVLTSGTELLTLRYTSRPLLSTIRVARNAMSSPLWPLG